MVFKNWLIVLSVMVLVNVTAVDSYAAEVKAQAPEKDYLSADAGDDLTQSTIERALRRIHQWQQGTRLDSWMFRIARNINIDEARARIRRTAQIDYDAIDNAIGEDGRQITETRSTLACARTAMAKLSDDQRALMMLVVVEGQSYREAADTLHIPIGTVMSRIARARRTIDEIVNEAA